MRRFLATMFLAVFAALPVQATPLAPFPAIDWTSLLSSVRTWVVVHVVPAQKDGAASESDESDADATPPSPPDSARGSICGDG